jgi:hypothetical protein
MSELSDNQQSDPAGCRQRGFEEEEKYGVNYMQEICHQLWEQPQINWEGRVLGGCRNFWGDFGGNALNDGLFQAINNETIQYAREMLRGRQAARADIPCSTCEIYLGMQGRQRWLQRGFPLWLCRGERTVRQFGRAFLQASPHDLHSE